MGRGWKEREGEGRWWKEMEGVGEVVEGGKVGGSERACQIREGGREGGLLSHPCTTCSPV